jgi:hypothetical protein
MTSGINTIVREQYLDDGLVPATGRPVKGGPAIAGLLGRVCSTA